MKCNLPLFYSHVSELASFIVPIDTTQSRTTTCGSIRSDGSLFHSSALVAAAVETCMSPLYLRSAHQQDVRDERLTAVELTRNGRYFFLECNIALPSDSSPTPPEAMSSGVSLSSAVSGAWASDIQCDEPVTQITSQFSRGLTVGEMHCLFKTYYFIMLLRISFRANYWR